MSGDGFRLKVKVEGQAVEDGLEVDEVDWYSQLTLHAYSTSTSRTRTRQDRHTLL